MTAPEGRVRQTATWLARVYVIGGEYIRGKAETRVMNNFLLMFVVQQKDRGALVHDNPNVDGQMSRCDWCVGVFNVIMRAHAFSLHAAATYDSRDSRWRVVNAL